MDEYLVLWVLFPKCRKKHPLREFPIDNVKVCGLCQLEHDKHPKSKEVFQASAIARRVKGITLVFFNPSISCTLALNFIAIFWISDPCNPCRKPVEFLWMWRWISHDPFEAQSCNMNYDSTLSGPLLSTREGTRSLSLSNRLRIIELGVHSTQVRV